MGKYNYRKKKKIIFQLKFILKFNLIHSFHNRMAPRTYPIIETIVGPLLPLVGFIAQKFVFDRPVIQEKRKNQ